MARSKGERAILREEKRKEKERLKRIEEANKMLIPVPKVTRESLKLIAFDPNGTFRFEGNRWVRVYRFCDIYQKMEDLKLSNLVKKLQSKMKITTEVAAGVFAPGQENYFVTLTASGETYDEVRSIYKEDEEALRGYMNLVSLAVDDVFGIITKQSESNSFSYASMVRGKKDWMKELPKVSEESEYFLMNGAYGECSICLQFPSFLLANVTEKLGTIGCPVVVSLELNPIRDEDNLDFNRSLEKRYNKRLTNGMTTTNYYNASYQLLFICDSADAREIIEKTIFSLYAKEGFILSPSIGMQERVAMGILSLGLISNSNMRNVKDAVIDQIGIQGGNHGCN